MQADQAESMMNLWVLGFVFAVMLLGAIAHWTKKKVRGEVSGNLIDYLFCDNPLNTGYTVVGIASAAFTAATTGTADIIDPRLLWAMATETGSIPMRSFIGIVLTLKSGWFFDSWLNKGGKP